MISPVRLYLTNHGAIVEGGPEARRLLVGEGCSYSKDFDSQFGISNYLANRAKQSVETKAIESAPENKAVTNRRTK